MDKRQYLTSLTYEREEVDGWLAGTAYTSSKYDSELGYIHREGQRQDGIDGSTCTYSYDENDARH